MENNVVSSEEQRLLPKPPFGQPFCSFLAENRTLVAGRVVRLF